MFENVLSGKWSTSELKNFMGFMMIYKIYEKQLTPGRYRVPYFVQTKKRRHSLCTKGYFGKYKNNITNTLAITEKFLINFTAANYTDKDMYPISVCIKHNDGDFVTSRYTGEIVHFEANPVSYCI